MYAAFAGGAVNQLVAYLLEHLILDFDGDLTLDMVRDFLRDDDSRESKALLARLVEDRGVSEMLICIADCLRESVSNGVRAEEMREQLRLYAES
jgi:L-aminopeptidase/D-esterase-like protein